MDKALRQKIKDYYEYHGDKLKSVRTLTKKVYIYDEDGNPSTELLSTVYSCAVKTSTGYEIAELLYSSYDAYGNTYVTDTGYYAPIEEREELENAWRNEDYD